jgi:hypothetical protein
MNKLRVNKLLMRTFIPLFFFALIFTSCSKYQYLTVSSDNTARNERNDFVVENDTVKVSYRFFGFNGPILISVSNKTSAGIRVDWSRSFLINGPNPVPLYTPVNNVSGDLVKGGKYNNTVQFTASVSEQTPLEFIPPQAAISRLCKELVPKNYINTDNYKMVRERIRLGNFSQKIRRTNLTKENTPLSFRIYLTLVPESRPDEIMVFDRQFYISELIATKADPDEMYPVKNGNLISLQRSTTTGTLLTIGVALGIITALAAIAGNN